MAPCISKYLVTVCVCAQLEDMVGRLQANFDKAKDQLSETQEKLVKSEKVHVHRYSSILSCTHAQHIHVHAHIQ